MNYEDISGPDKLNDAEVEALRDEVLHKWRQPFALYATIVICSIGAAVQGWDQTGTCISEKQVGKIMSFSKFLLIYSAGTNGANLEFPGYLGIGAQTSRNQFLIGLINAAPYIGSCFLGCWASDPMNSYMGRRGTIFVCANFCLWAVLGSAFVKTWPQLLICRLLLGV